MSRFPSSVRFEYVEAHSSNFTRGKWRKDFIVIHHWDDPAKRPQFDGVVSWFRNPSANVSIQYMVESGRVTQMIPESAMAWHAGNSTANRHGIGLELNPRQSSGDYETAAQVVAEIWKRRGRKLPLRKHREFFGTSCPGTYDLSRIRRRAEQIYSGTSSTPASSSGGSTMSWSTRLKSHITGNNLQAGTMLRDAQRKAHQARQAARQAVGRLKDLPSAIWNLKNGQSGTSMARHVRRGDFRFRGLDYVNENPSTKDAQIARAHQYSRDARSEAREVKSIVKALASALDDSTGKIIEAVESAEREAIQVNAKEVAEELRLTTADDEDKD